MSVTFLSSVGRNGSQVKPPVYRRWTVSADQTSAGARPLRLAASARDGSVPLHRTAGDAPEGIDWRQFPKDRLRP
ncbi:hypothetical protein KCP77_24820 (plasmid) [Salmonella enterica subsp. enterica]|nr:hypothetical protein KCP77_24820 [Salmonella enterica subsp. enterica]